MRLRGEEMRRAWAEFVGRIPWEWFVTLTFARFSVSRDLAGREAFRWCGDAAHSVRRPLGWVYVVERGRGGRWHAHVLIVGVGEADLRPALAVWAARNGGCDCQPVAAVHGAAVYTTKDAADDGEIVLSDTLAQYKRLLGPDEVARLHP